MKKVMLFAALAIAALVSCNKEISVEEVIKPDAVPEGYVPFTLNARQDMDTKALLVDNMIVWLYDEEVAVFADGAGDPLKFKVSNTYTMGNISGVSISGNAPEGTKSFVAVYPWQEGLTCVDGVVSLNIPEKQHIPADAVVDPQSMPSVAYFASAESEATFRNVMSLIKFNVGKTEGVEEVRVVFGDGAYSAGAVTATLDVENGGAPEIGNKCDAYAVVTAEGGFLPETDYWISVAPVKSTGIKAVARVDNTAYNKVSDKEIVLERNKGINLGDITLEASIKFVGIKNAEDLVAFLADAGAYTKDDVVEFINNIDMAGVALVEDVEGSHAAASEFAGVLDGCGHSILNWAADGVGLFKTVTGKVKGITIDSSCSFSNVPTGNFSFLVSNLNNGAYVGDCVNKASVIIDAGDGTVQYRYGSLVGVSQKSALIERCENYGNIDFKVTTGSANMNTQYVGGVVACLNGAANALRLYDCHNYANYLNVTMVNGEKGTQFRNTYVGGVVATTGINKGSSSQKTGYTSYYGEINSCTNSADITVTWTGGTGGYMKVGGVLAYGECLIANCVNNGNVSFAITDPSMNASSPSVGGVAGVVCGTAPVSAYGCENKGNVTLTGAIHNAAASGAYATGVGGIINSNMGGCFGIIGDSATKVENCTNYGKVTSETTTSSTAGSSHMAGGVVGYSMAELSNCDNLGLCDITIKAKTGHFGGVVGYCTMPMINCDNNATLNFCHNVDQLATPTDQAAAVGNAGGIVGYSGTKTGNLSNCTNTAAINFDNIIGQVRLGGIGGMVYGTVDDCVNSAPVTLAKLETEASGCAHHVGGVVGYHNLADAAIKNCSNSATVKVNLDSKAGTSNIGGVIGNLQTKNTVDDCSNTGEVIVDSGGAPGSMRVGGVVGNMSTANSDLTGLNNSANVTAINFNGTAVNNFFGGVLGRYNSSDNDLKACVNTGDVTVDGAGAVRVGGLCGGLFGSFTDCSTEGTVTVKRATNTDSATSHIGGLSGYGSASVSGCSVKSTIVVSDVETAVPVGLLFGTVYRELTVKGLTVDSTIIGENLNAGYLFGKVNVDDPAQKTIVILGAEGEPVTLKSSCSINGVAVMENPSTDNDLIADISGKIETQEENILNYVNVVVE